MPKFNMGAIQSPPVVVPQVLELQARIDALASPSTGCVDGVWSSSIRRHPTNSHIRCPGSCGMGEPTELRVAQCNRVWRSHARGKDWWSLGARCFSALHGRKRPPRGPNRQFRRRDTFTRSTRRRTIRTLLRSSRDARCGLREVRVGEASHPSPPSQGVRRAISVPEEVLDDLEAALTRIDSSGSDDEPLVRPSSGRNVMPRRCVAEGSQGGDPAIGV